MHFACSVEIPVFEKSTVGDHSFCTNELSHKTAVRVRVTQKQMVTDPIPPINVLK